MFHSCSKSFIKAESENICLAVVVLTEQVRGQIWYKNVRIVFILKHVRSSFKRHIWLKALWLLWEKQCSCFRSPQGCWTKTYFKKVHLIKNFSYFLKWKYEESESVPALLWDLFCLMLIKKRLWRPLGVWNIAGLVKSTSFISLFCKQTWGIQIFLILYWRHASCCSLDAVCCINPSRTADVSALLSNTHFSPSPSPWCKMFTPLVLSSSEEISFFS